MILLEGLSHISLGSSDIPRSVAFYRDILDFEVAEEDEDSAQMRLNPVEIRLNRIEGYRSAVKTPGQASISFVLDVDDFTNAISDLENAEVEILEGPVSIEGGESLLISDPDGNFIELYYRE